MAFNLSTKWKIQTPQADEVNNPPLYYKNMVQGIEDRTAGAAQIVATIAGRDAIPSAELYDGKRVFVVSDSTEHLRMGGLWRTVTIDSGWVPLAYSAGWAPAGLAAVRLIDGIVYLRGYFSSSAAWAAGATMATLPAGFRPTADAFVAARIASVFQPCRINTSGQIQIDSSSAAANSVIPLSVSWVAA